MRKFSFLTSLRPFRGVVADIQCRALRSWRQVHPDVEIIVYGDCPGIETVADCGIRHVPDIACGVSGPPLLNAIAAHAARKARHDIQMYVNGDILLHRCTRDAAAIMRRRFEPFLGVGQRVDLAEGRCVHMAAPDAAGALRKLGAAGETRLHSPSGKDYLLFPRGVWQDLPAPVVGSCGAFDCALLAHCLRAGIPLVDCTTAIPALHLWHDYGHLNPGRAEAMEGPETAMMRRQYGVAHSAPTVAACGWALDRGRAERDPCRGDAMRHSELWLRFRRGAVGMNLAVRALWRLCHCRGPQPARWRLEDVVATVTAGRADGPVSAAPGGCA